MSNPTAYDDADLAPPRALDLPRKTAVQMEVDEEPVVAKDPDAIPELATIPADSDNLRIEALRLTADSVAQQRQRASRAIIFHPATIGIAAVALGLVIRILKGDTGGWSDYAIPATTFFGVLMAMLIAIRGITGGYIDEAERVGTWKWFNQGRGAAAEKETGQKVLGDRDDEVLLTKFGDEFIGTIIFRGIQPVEDVSKRSSRRSNPGVPTKCEIRAWTVRQKYRGKGVGTALLEDAIKIAHDKGWTSGGIELASDHANSKIVLPNLFSGFVRANDEQTRKYLEKKVAESEEANNAGGKGKRRR